MKELSFSSLWYWFLLMGAVCYLLGSFNFAILISRLRHKDVRTLGSGNPGTMNMFREFGFGIGLATFLLDALKGGIPAIISYFIFRGTCFAGTSVLVSDFTRYFCGVCVIIGHIFPIMLRFHGGKGIASTLGLFWLCLAAEKWWYLLFGTLFLLFIATYILKIHWGSMGSLMGVTGFSLWQGIIFLFRYEECLANGWVIAIFACLLALNILTWLAHRQNIVRLLSGEEHLTGGKKKKTV